MSTISAYTDANWEGDAKFRRSTSGGVVLFGQHWAKAWSNIRTFIAPSSAESELFVPVKATAGAFDVQAMAGDLEQRMEIRVTVDASAALGTISRRGLGKVRHLDANHLWTQEVAAKKSAKFEDVSGKSNPADMMTKGSPKHWPKSISSLLLQPTPMGEQKERHKSQRMRSTEKNRRWGSSTHTMEQFRVGKMLNGLKQPTVRERHYWLPRGQSLPNLWVGAAMQMKSVEKKTYTTSL